MKSTERFTQTVDHYIKYRPSYPKKILQVLKKDCNLTPSSFIADVGSGTGILTKLFLDFGNHVFAVEPNQAMRKAAEKNLKDYPNFQSIQGSAEQTTLASHSIDIIAAGTAFHWFDSAKSQIEFQRILKPEGWVLLVWNVRDIVGSPLVRDYEYLILKFCPEYRNSKAKEFEKTAMQEFFSPSKMRTKTFPNKQKFDWEGLKGRLLSTSYCLTPRDNKYEEMLQELKTIFERYQKNGSVNFLYETKLYYGQLG